MQKQHDVIPRQPADPQQAVAVHCEPVAFQRRLVQVEDMAVVEYTESEDPQKQSADGRTRQSKVIIGAQESKR